VAVSTLPQVSAGHREGAQSLVVPRDPHHSTQALQTCQSTPLTVITARFAVDPSRGLSHCAFSFPFVPFPLLLFLIVFSTRVWTAEVTYCLIKQLQHQLSHMPLFNCNRHHTTTVLRLFFRDHPGEPVPEENFWTLWCKGRLTEADTPTIRLGATPSGLNSAHLHHTPIFLQAGCPSCRATNSVKALNATSTFRLNRGYMCNLLHAICCRGAKITVQLF